MEKFDIIRQLFDLGVTAVVAVGAIYLLLKFVVTPMIKSLRTYSERVADLAEQTGKIADRVHEHNKEIKREIKQSENNIISEIKKNR